MEEVENPEKNISIVEEARQIRDEIIRQKEELQKTRDDIERLQTNNMLGGRSNAGEETEEKPKEETPKEYADKIMSGGAND